MFVAAGDLRTTPAAYRLVRGIAIQAPCANGVRLGMLLEETHLDSSLVWQPAIVGVQQRQELAGGLCNPEIPSCADAAILSVGVAQQAQRNRAVLFQCERNVSGGVARSVVADQNLE